MEHVERTRVAWADTDAGGRIHHAATFRYAEEAETAFLRQAGLLWVNGDFPRRHVEADFRSPLHFEDEIEVHIRPERVGRTSVSWSWEIYREGEVCVTGRHTMVHVDELGTPALLSAEMRRSLTNGS